MAERKLRFDSANTVAVPHPRGGVPEPDNTTPPVSPSPAENAEAADYLSSPNRTAHEPRHDFQSPLVRQPSNDLKRAVQQALDSQPAVNFSSLEIRQIEGGICLEGVLETNDQPPDIEHLVRSVADVDRILNRLVVRQLHEPEN